VKQGVVLRSACTTTIIIRIAGCFRLVNNLLTRESTAGETRMHLISRSEFVLLLQRDSQPNAGPKNAST